MKYLGILIISFYQLAISPMLRVVFGYSCRYPITCSQFTKVAIEKYGMIKGLKMGTRRILSCHPWSKNYV